MSGAGMEDIRVRLQQLRDSVSGICRRTGRSPEEIRIVLVTKTVAAERVREAWEAGGRDFGENRVQELLQKKPVLPAEICWHMIGHLQTNKVKQVLGEVVLIHSLDRRELALEIQKQAEKKKIDEVACLIQVNSSKETTKSGFDLEEVEPFVAETEACPRIRIRGLMTIGPLTEDARLTREAFRKTRELREHLKKRFPEKDWGILSMGMSGDYEIAVEEGANLLRLGTVIFGSRK